MAAFLNAAGEFAPLARDEIRDRLPGATKDLINDAGHLRSWPWQHGLEAFFGAVCMRVDRP